MKSFGERLETLRKLLGLRQEEMAKLLGVSLRAYSDYIKNRKKPTYEKLIPLINKGVNLYWLLTGEGEPFIREGEKREGIGEEDMELLRLIKNLPEDEREMLKKLLKRAVERGKSGSTSTSDKNF